MHHLEHRHNQSTTYDQYSSHVITSPTFLTLSGLIVRAESKVSLTKFPFKKLLTKITNKCFIYKDQATQRNFSRQILATDITVIHVNCKHKPRYWRYCYCTKWGMKLPRWREKGAQSWESTKRKISKGKCTDLTCELKDD